MALRLAELLGALSLATDLANGLAPEHGLRIALLATHLAEGDTRVAARDVYWTGLLRYLGCNGFAVEEARFGAGDDIGLRAAGVPVEDLEIGRADLEDVFLNIMQGEHA